MIPMTTPMQKAAMALFELSAEPEHGECWDRLSDEWKENFVAHARAAFATLLPPSPEMIEAGVKAMMLSSVGMVFDDAFEKPEIVEMVSAAFTAMINAGCE